MPETIFPVIKETRLGSAPPEAVLRFVIPKNGGYTVEATLFLESRVVSMWASSEILGKTTDQALIPQGLYTLQIDIVFTKNEEAEVKLEFSTRFDDVQLQRRTLTFKGKRPEIARALALVRIEKP
jgi:hypothetical protein